MPSFIYAYHGGKKPDTPEEGAAEMEKWKAWVEGLGEAMTNPGTPLGMSKTLSADGVADNGGPNPLAGFSVVTADSIDAAVEMAKDCPFLKMGTIEVAEMLEMQ